jgi:hypothetical protein
MTAAALPLADPDDVDRLGDDLRAAGYDADGVPDLLGAGAHNALGRGHRWPALHVTAAAAAGTDLIERRSIASGDQPG